MKVSLRNGIGSIDSAFAAMIAITWLAFFKLAPCGHSNDLLTAVCFSITASVVAHALLRAFGYFDPHHLVPRKSDPLLVAVAVTAGGFVALKGFSALFDIVVCSSSTVFVWMQVFSLPVFGAHYLFSLWRVTRAPKKIVIDLLPDQRVQLLAHLESCSLTRFVQPLARHELHQHLLRGAKSEISMIIISRETADRFDTDGALLQAHVAGIPIVDFRRLRAEMLGRVEVNDSDVWSYLLCATAQTPMLRLFAQAKRIYEPLLAAVLLTLFSPIMITIALAIRRTSEGPILFRQTRTGYLGKSFVLYKFRSMRCDAEKDGPQWCSSNDDRVTRVGHFLRKTRLDELPQLINVIRGEMGFFGPRPERPEIYQSIKRDIPLFSLRTVVRPGITGWAQVLGGYASSVAESARKLEYDLYYIQHLSPRLDFIIALKTLALVVRGHDANSTQRQAEHVRTESSVVQEAS